MKADKLHEYHVNNLCAHPSLMNEDFSGLEWILKEGIWQKYGSLGQYKMPDIILFFYNSQAVPVEIKRSTSHQAKAIEQLRSGEMFANQLGYNVPYKKIIYYGDGKHYTVEHVK